MTSYGLYSYSGSVGASRARATCKVCRRHRIIFNKDDDGRALCSACGADPPKTHICPTCQRVILGGGHARCHTCALAVRVEGRITLDATNSGSIWARGIFTSCCRSDALRKERGNMTSHISRYAKFFRTIDGAIDREIDVTQVTLQSLFTSVELRQNFQPVSFLIDALKIKWCTRLEDQLREQARINVILNEAASCSWLPDLAAFQESLACGPLIGPRTQRQYISVAANFLASAEVGRVDQLTEAHVRGYLRRTPGNAASLARF